MFIKIVNIYYHVRLEGKIRESCREIVFKGVYLNIIIYVIHVLDVLRQLKEQIPEQQTIS